MMAGLLRVEPFSKLSKSGKEMLTDGFKVGKYTIGERIYRQDEMPSRLHFIVKGEARLLVESFERKFTNNAKKDRRRDINRLGRDCLEGKLVKRFKRVWM